jgi:hypothetical protein
MKSSFILISILAVTAILAGAQTAQAQNETGARWKFAPNVYKLEQPRIPANLDGPHQVNQGSVPHSANFLTGDPGMLTKPVAKPIVPATQVSHKLFVPNTATPPSTTFKPDFGKPNQPLQAGEPVRMTTLPPGAGSPISQKPAPPTANQAAAPVQQPKHSAPRHHSTAVKGTLKTPVHAHGESATPVAASYSTGYTPGGLLPAQSGVGMSSRADVSGRIIKQKH